MNDASRKTHERKQPTPPCYRLLFCLFAMVICRASSSPAQDLRVFQSAHYRIHTDLDSDFSDDLAKRMDVMYDEYARRLADFPRPDSATPLEAYLVHTREKYMHVSGLSVLGTGGVFNSQRRLLASFLDGQGRDAMRRVLQHEAFHQFAFDAIGHNMPVWLNEGLAQVFEEGIWTGDGFDLGQVPPRRLRQLHHEMDDDSLMDFPRMLSMTSAEWFAGFGVKDAAAQQYNQAWAMAQFLVYSQDDSGNFKYRARLIDMLHKLHDGMDGGAAFRAAFSDNIAGFRDRFVEYVDQLHPTAKAVLIENQGVLADFLINLRKQGHTFDTIDQFRDVCVNGDFQMRYRVGGLLWQSAADSRVYFRSPAGDALSTAELHFELSGGRALQDLVCHCPGYPALRTRFEDDGGHIEHETVVDAGD